MVAKSIAKMYTNIHKPTDYGLVVSVTQEKLRQLESTHRRLIWCVKCPKFCVSTHEITLTSALPLNHNEVSRKPGPV